MVSYESPYDPASAPTDLEFVTYAKRDHVAYVTINRPEVRNALHSYAYVDLRRCWRDIQLDPEVFVGVVAGPVARSVPGGTSSSWRSTRTRGPAPRTRTRTARSSTGVAAGCRTTRPSRSR